MWKSGNQGNAGPNHKAQFVPWVTWMLVLFSNVPFGDSARQSINSSAIMHIISLLLFHVAFFQALCRVNSACFPTQLIHCFIESISSVGGRRFPLRNQSSSFCRLQLFNVNCDHSFVSLANRKRRSTRGTPKEPSGTRRNPTDVLVRAALAQGSTQTRLCVAIVLLHQPASIGNVPFVEAGVARIGCSASFGAASPAAPVHLGTADVAPEASGVTACVCWAASCVPPLPSLVHG